MEYQEVKCRNCGSPMHVAEDAERIRCPYCGTEYVLKSQCNETLSASSTMVDGVHCFNLIFQPNGITASLMIMIPSLH